MGLPQGGNNFFNLFNLCHIVSRLIPEYSQFKMWKASIQFKYNLNNVIFMVLKAILLYIYITLNEVHCLSESHQQVRRSE